MGCRFEKTEYDGFEEFRGYIAEHCTIEAACGRTFVATSRSNHWLTAICEQCQKPHLEQLLRAAQKRISGESAGLRKPSHVVNPSALVLFTILVQIEHPECLEEFSRVRINDASLPLEKSALMKKLRVETSVPSEDQLQKKTVVEQFFDAQFEFCPHVFELDSGPDLGHRNIIPIMRKEEINTKGGTAELFQVEVLEEFVGNGLRERLPKSRYYVEDGFGWRYHFALKCFKGSDIKRYQREIDAFSCLRRHEGMVKCVAHFSQRDNLRAVGKHPSIKAIAATHNLLLEYGDSDLDVYFAEYHPPLLNNEILGFWKELFEVAKAVEAIHNYKRSFDMAGFHGWHADIKPDNILLIEGKFKLADPGFAKFVPQTGSEPRHAVEGGTWAFAAPEHHPGSPPGKAQKNDIWALGCLFSIAATWMARGYGAVEDFARVRERAVERLRADHPGSSELLPPGESFHDGKRVLVDIAQWHAILRGLLPSPTSITSQVLDIVERNMLLEDPEDRITAKALCERLQHILDTSPRQTSAPQNIIDALQKKEEKVRVFPKMQNVFSSAQPLNSSSGTAQPRKNKKSQILANESKKTAQRSEYLAIAQQTRRHSRHFPYRHSQGSLSKSPPTRPTISTIITGSKTSTGIHPRRDIFQVRNQLKLKHINAGKALSARMFEQIFGASQKVDSILQRYFRNYDIRFLVDNAYSMDRHWAKAMFVVETMVLLGQGLDEDGMDLWFTRGGEALKSKKDAEEFVAAMEDERNRPQKDTQTDMHKAIYEVFDAHVQDLMNPKRERKNLLLLILTDGIWEETDDREGVGATIVKAEERVRQVFESFGSLRQKPVGIQFIQLGRDPEATLLLRTLDDEVTTEEESDIIDHEHSDGDVNKMFLGSLEKKYDEVPYDETLSPRQRSFS